MSTKEFTPLALWGMFLGVFGAHRFYVGRNGSAIAMLILSLTGIGLLVTIVWAFIDNLYIAIGRFHDSQGREVLQPGQSERKCLGTAMLLAQFFGLLGVHRFYAGKTGSGIVMLLLTMSVIGYIITVIWLFVDRIYLAMGRFTDGLDRNIGHQDVYSDSSNVFS